MSAVTESDTNKKPLFRDLNADEPEPETTEIESLCVECENNGITKLLLTKIPYYKEVVIMSFECENCGNKNNEIQPGGKIEEKGVRYTLTVQNKDDLNRQVVKSDYTAIKIPHLDFEIPSQSQKGEVTTMEGIIDRAIEGLKQDQTKRKIEHPEIASKIDEFIERLNNLKSVENPFTVILEDISGNCFVENPRIPEEDAWCKLSQFVRSKEEDHKLGIYESKEVGVLHEPEEKFTYEDLQSEVLTFQTNCPGCNAPCDTNMKLTNIPYFKEVVIMATNCGACGLRTNEVKSGSGVESKGVLIEVNVRSKEDLCRDILKSETCSVKVPEIALDVGPTTLGGKFSTVEGLLIAMKDQLFTQSTIFSDSQPKRHVVFQKFLDKLNSLIMGQLPFHMILDDPAGNSYVQSLTSPEPDPNLKVTQYERTFEQNEDLGLNDINTESYTST